MTTKGQMQKTEENKDRNPENKGQMAVALANGFTLIIVLGGG